MKLNWILIDSFKEEYLKHTPFLKSLAEEHSFSSLEPVAGYQQYLASFFTGKKPDEIDVWSIFRYSPETSLFRWTKLLPPLKQFDKKTTKYGIDFISYFFSGTSDMSKVRIPLKLMRYFDLGMKNPITYQNCLNTPTVFDDFRSNNLSFSYIKGLIKLEGQDFPLKNFRHYLFSNDERTIAFAKKSQKKRDVLFTYLVQLDGLGHKYGPDSKEVKAHLNKIDALLEDFLPKDTAFLLHSDHGMVKVEKSINLWKKIEDLGLELGKDYLFFMDSVMVRFWFFTKKAEDEIKNLLQKTEGKILTKADLKKHGLSFHDNSFGDLIFFANYATVFAPNFWQVCTSKPDAVCGPKGMHGYLPEKDEYGILITNQKPPKNPTYLDLTPLVRNSLGLG